MGRVGRHAEIIRPSVAPISTRTVRSARYACGLDVMVAIQTGNGSGLAKMLDSLSPGPMSVDPGYPCHRCRMAVDEGDQFCIVGHDNQ